MVELISLGSADLFWLNNLIRTFNFPKAGFGDFRQCPVVSGPGVSRLLAARPATTSMPRALPLAARPLPRPRVLNILLGCAATCWPRGLAHRNIKGKTPDKKREKKKKRKKIEDRFVRNHTEMKNAHVTTF